MRRTAMLLALVALPSTAHASETDSTSGPAALSAARADGRPAMVASDDNGKKKKKHKKKDDEEAFGPDDIGAADTSDNGAGVHREQIGVDKPYFNELSGSTTLSFLTVKTGSASPQSETDIDIGGAFLVILGHLELGPEVRYASTQTSMTTTTTDAAGKATTASASETMSSYSVGPLLKINFGSIDHATLVPFVLAGVGYAAESAKTGSSTAVDSTGYTAHFGGGINMFISSGVAFQPTLEYRLESAKPSGSASSASGASAASTDATTTSGVRVAFGIGTFL